LRVSYPFATRNTHPAKGDTMTISRRNLFNPNRWYSPQASAQSFSAAFGDNQALHLLNRITWSARPDELARVNNIGIDAYLDEQLNPNLADESNLEAHLKDLPILKVARRDAYALDDSEWRLYKTLVIAALRRAIYSPNQLLERMTEFWTDHFNINADNAEYNPDLLLLHKSYRKNALGNFRDLLFETAKSPAMLVYLDNFVNGKDEPNENYARELMELHTLGVDGGYTEADIKAVARAFTGWTIHYGTRTGFYFDADNHDTASKHIFGHTLPAKRGIEDGLHVLDIVANHPSTAKFICRKLCIRFVSDDPPASLVDDLTQIWTANKGEIKPVLRHLFLSDEFQKATGQKFRRPFDFLVGALRATGTEFEDLWTLQQIFLDLGQSPFGWHTPDGYPDTANAWISTGGMLSRWNVAMQLTHGAYSDVEQEGALNTQLFERIGMPKTVDELVDAVSEQVFGAKMSADAKAPFVAFTADGGNADMSVTAKLIAQKLGSLYGLMLATPLFQWR